MKAALYPGEVVYDASNFHTLLGDGKQVFAAGEMRLLSRVPPPPGHNAREYSTPFEDAFQTIPRSEWSARCKEQLERKARISDCQTWPALDQDGTPQCWSNGVAGAAATCRVIQGLPFVRLSPASVAVPISGGTAGGYEGDAVRYGQKHGWAPASIFPQHSTDRSLCDKQEVIDSRKKFMLLEVYDLGNSFDQLATALLLNLPAVASYPDWSHVTEICDLVEIESGSFGCRGKNSWGNDWGSKNAAGSGGFFIFREHGGPHCNPQGIFALRQLTVHAGTEYISNVG